MRAKHALKVAQLKYLKTINTNVCHFAVLTLSKSDTKSYDNEIICQDWAQAIETFELTFYSSAISTITDLFGCLGYDIYNFFLSGIQDHVKRAPLIWKI